MTHIILHEFCLILLGIYQCHGYECSGGPMRTLTNAANINSNVLHEYLRHLHCQSDDEFATWHKYTGKCITNATCVGIRATAPFAICTRLSVSRDQPVPIENLWLILSEIQKFGMLISIFFVFEVFICIL